MMTRYNSLGELLHAYREFMGRIYGRPYTQADMAYELRIRSGERTWGKWERDECSPNAKSVIHLAEQTRLPVEALTRLRDGYPTYYNLRSNRYSLGPYHTSLMNAAVLRDRLFIEDAVACRGRGAHTVTSLGTFGDGAVARHPQHGEEMRALLAFHGRLFKHARQVDEGVLTEAVNRLPELNLLLRDHLGHYAGHVLTIGLTASASARLRSRASEASIGLTDLADRDRTNMAALHIYSLLAVETTYAYRLVAQFVRALASAPMVRFKERGGILSRLAVTADAVDMCAAFGLRAVYADPDYHREHGTEVRPEFYSTPLADLAWLYHDH